MPDDAMKNISDINQGDLLIFKAADEKYKALLCISTYKDRSPYHFQFAALTYDNVEKPTVENILENEFWGIGNRKNDYYRYSDTELNKIWTFHPEIKPCSLGAYGLTIWRKDFMKFRDNFEVIGNLKIIDNLDKTGNGGMNASAWNTINDFFINKYMDKIN
jgi:hypothetical protein